MHLPSLARRNLVLLRIPATLLALWALSVSLLPPASATGATSFPSVRGVTLSTHRSGQEWGADEIVPTLEGIVRTGATWVAIHPYAWIDRTGTVAFREIDVRQPPSWLRRPIAEAHRQGLKILIKPHLGYWGSGFSWRGDIRFDSDEQWARFFESYRRWVVQLARSMGDADAYCVGTELDATLGHEAQWRALVHEVREVYDGPLTYAANWGDYQRVPFWDALDAIGIQAYFPISSVPVPDEAELRRGWSALRGRLSAYSRSSNRPVLFTELGYNESLRAASEPWRYEVDGPAARDLQARCLRIALEQIEAEPTILGAFLWKWFPEPHPVGRNFQLAVPHMLEAIAQVWGRNRTD